MNLFFVNGPEYVIQVEALFLKCVEPEMLQILEFRCLHVTNAMVTQCHGSTQMETWISLMCLLHPAHLYERIFTEYFSACVFLFCLFTGGRPGFSHLLYYLTTPIMSDFAVFQTLKFLTRDIHVL